MCFCATAGARKAPGNKPRINVAGREILAATNTKQYVEEEEAGT